MSVTISLHAADIEACIEDWVRHYRTYGLVPQPHMKAEAERDAARIGATLDQCWDVTNAPEG